MKPRVLTPEACPFIIGISGKKRSGKTTLAQTLYHLSHFRPMTEGGLDVWVGQIAFAEPLKDIVFETFCPPDWSPVHMEDRKYVKIGAGRTLREYLQWLGTDVFRAEWPDVWLNAYEHRLVCHDSRSVIVTPDVRFPNEVEFIHALGGRVLRLTRAPHAEDEHESEIALDNYHDFDFILDNSNLTEAEKNQIALPVFLQWIADWKEKRNGQTQP